jgi:fluoroquinolone resistance protein
MVNGSGVYHLKEKLHKISFAGGTLPAGVYEECLFESCSYIDCKFLEIKLINCVFKDCLLSAVSPLDCRFLEVKFAGCKVVGVDWTRTLEIRDLGFDQCQVDLSNFRFLKLAGLKIAHCRVKESDFTEADLTGSDFSHSDLEGTRFFKTNLSAANFKGAINYHIDVSNNIVKKARFSLPEAVALLKGMDIIIE